MKNELNVWRWDYRKRYYLIHPWKWFQELGWNIKSALDRIRKGYCDTDWINFDAWFKYIAPLMLRDLAMYGHAYPGFPPFDTPENWNSWLHRMADQIKECQDEDNGNEYYYDYIDMIRKHCSFDSERTEEEKELAEKYYNRSVEVDKEHKELFKKTMKELVEHWDCLWD